MRADKISTLVCLWPYSSVFSQRSGVTRLIHDFSLLLSSYFNVLILSLDKEGAFINRGKFSERVIEYNVSYNRIYYFINLIILSLFKINMDSFFRYRKLVREIRKSKANYLVSFDFLLSQNLKHDFPNSNLITYTDGPSFINSIVEERVMEIKIKLLNKLIKKTYNNYYIKKYRGMINSSDLIIFPSKSDMLDATKYFKNINATYFYPVLIKGTKNKIKIVKKIENIGFLGNGSFPPNIEAVDIIIRRIASKLKDKNFIIIGDSWIKHTEGNIKFLGYVKNLKKILSKIDLFIMPIQTGSGIKVKVADILASLKPMIGTRIAFNGYDLKSQKEVIITDKIDNFPKIIRKLDSNPNKILSMQKRLKLKLDKFNSNKKIKLINLVKIIENLQSTKE